MKIQKGIVKYKDREDIICTYGVTDDNRQYYFLDETDQKKFSNGNRIASKDLKEAIDPMVKASQVGVIDEEGNEVIPFVNRAIKPVNDDIILVEIANPVSQSVIDAVNLKNDPSAATQLVSTTSTIKDNLNQKMNGNGRFLFNDIFSEATVTDINGNNLVNGEYYSFIGLANDKLYFSKNNVNSAITEYSILPPEVQSDVTPNSDTNEINVNNVEVGTEVVENALNGTNEVSQEAEVSADVPPVVGEDNTVVESSVVTPTEDTNNVEVSNNEANLGEDVVAPSLGEEAVTDVNPENNISVPEGSVDSVTPQVDVPAVDNTVNTDASNGLEIPAVDSAVASDVSNVVAPEIPADAVASSVSAPSEGGEVVNADVNMNIPVVNEDVSASENVVQDVQAPVSEEASTTSDEVTAENASEVAAQNTNEVVSVVEDSVNPALPEVTAEENTNVVNNATDVNADTNNEVNNIDTPPVVPEVSESVVAESSDVTADSDDTPVESVTEEVSEENKEVTPISPEEVENTVAEDEKKEENEEVEEQPVDIFKEAEKDEQEEKEVEEEKVVTPKKSSGSKKSRRVPFSSVLPDKPVEIEDEEVDDYDSIVSSDKREKTALDKLFQSSSDDEIDDYSEDVDSELYSDSRVEEDTIDNKNEYNIDSFDEKGYKEASNSARDTIMSDIAKSMTSLMKQNRELKANLIDSRNKCDKISASRRNIADRAKMLEQKNDILGTKLHNEETMKNKAMAKVATLEAKVREQERIIASQTRELNSLRPQLAGKEDLVKILADASLLLDEDSNYNYDEDSYYRRAA